MLFVLISLKTIELINHFKGLILAYQDPITPQEIRVNLDQLFLTLDDENHMLLYAAALDLRFTKQLNQTGYALYENLGIMGTEFIGYISFRISKDGNIN